MIFALFFFYEISLLLISIALASWLHLQAKSSKNSLAIPIINIFATKISLGFFIPYVVTSLGLNYPKIYLLIALLIFLYVLLIFNKRPDCLTIPQSINEFLEKRKNLLLLLPFIVFGPLIFISIGPPHDFDSQLVINNLYDWSNNIPNPFDGEDKSGLVIWELGFLPSFVITKSGYFWCWINFQVLLVIAISSITIARRLQLNEWLATLSVIASLSLYHFWFYPGNFGIKSDIALCAGVIMFFLGMTLAVEQKNNSENTLLLSLGAAFILTKEMGPLLLVGVLFVSLYAYRESLSARGVISLFKGICFISIPLSGHEYLRNMFVHGNPVYPTPLKIGLLDLPGSEFRKIRGTIDGTSIVSNLDKQQVWDWWFGIGATPHPVGFLLPYAVILTLGLCVYVVINGLLKKNIPVWAPLACYAAFTWSVFFFLPWTASSPSGNLIFITQLRSLRYNLGGAILVELLVVHLLIRKGFLKEKVSYLFVFSNLISRLYLLYFEVPVEHYGALNYPNAPTGLYIGGTIILACSSVLIYLLPAKMRGAGMLVLLFGLVASSPYVFEQNRNFIGDRWIPITKILAESPGTSVFLMSELAENAGGLVPYVYAAAGNHFQHSVTRGTYSYLSDLSREKKSPAYVGVISPPPGLSEKDIVNLTRSLSELGYLKLDSDKWSAIYKLGSQTLPAQSSK